ncbi:MAG TPA: choice-of-anchor tandem repeat GloVer-containing protein [Chthoniobacter sp.]
MSIPSGRGANPIYVPVAGLKPPPINPVASLASDGAGNYWGTTSAGGANNHGTVFKINAGTGTITMVADFTNASTGGNQGTDLVAGLVSDGAGNFWSTTSQGGANNDGTVFKINASTGAVTTIVNFANATTGSNRGGYPRAALVSDGAGNFWGTTAGGGANGDGTVFEVNVSTGVVTTVVDFANAQTGGNRGANPYGALVSDGAGNFLGTTKFGGANVVGTVFKVNASTGTITTIVDFAYTSGSNRGGYPQAGLVSDGAGNFWGTTSQGGVHSYGTVFKMSGGAITTITDFTDATTGSSRGGSPEAPLVSDGAGYLWGTTTSGGANGAGTVFKVNASTGVVTTVVDFANAKTGSTRGADPEAALVSDGAGNLWGTTTSGGANGAGTVFEIAASTGTISTVMDFASAPLNPAAGLVSDGAGNLWGTTTQAGANNDGTVFKVNASTGAITTVVDFASTTTGSNRGGNPGAPLVSDGAGNFWGTTAYGGAHGAGTVFEVNASTGAITTVADFAEATTGSNRGANPSAALVSDGAGNFWGTTPGGGANFEGTVFKINASTGTITTVVDFDNATTGSNRGSGPRAALVSDGAGNLWSTTEEGGAYDWGTVFEINASTGVITMVADFAASPSGPNRGAYPYAALVSDGAGNFWGTTYQGGNYAAGTVFKVNASTGAITTVVDFVDSTTGSSRGSSPEGALVNDGAGNLWGMTSQTGAYGWGTIFEINASTGAVTTVFDFTGPVGSVPGGQPSGALLLAQDGLYGTAPSGGVAGGEASGSGEIFFIDFGPAIGAFTPSGITGNGATLSGSANPGGIATSVYVQYGTDTTYGSQTSSTALGNGSNSVPFNVTLSGLSPATTYQYQLVFVTANGTFYSANQTFTTAASVPALPIWGFPILILSMLALAHRALSRWTGYRRQERGSI